MPQNPTHINLDNEGVFHSGRGRTQQVKNKQDWQTQKLCRGRFKSKTDIKKKRPQSLHEKLWVLVVCDNMKIVDVPEEGRRCFIFGEVGPERKSRRNKWVRQSKKKALYDRSQKL